tara:strand:+ start:5210 stop:5950 length:741 start_codon:yes stop_codon:yes gene_type:complete
MTWEDVIKDVSITTTRGKVKTDSKPIPEEDDEDCFKKVQQFRQWIKNYKSQLAIQCRKMAKEINEGKHGEAPYFEEKHSRPEYRNTDGKVYIEEYADSGDTYGFKFKVKGSWTPQIFVDYGEWGYDSDTGSRHIPDDVYCEVLRKWANMDWYHQGDTRLYKPAEGGTPNELHSYKIIKDLQDVENLTTYIDIYMGKSTSRIFRISLTVGYPYDNETYENIKEHQVKYADIIRIMVEKLESFVRNIL